MGDRLGTLGAVGNRSFFRSGVYGPIGLKLGSIAPCGIAGRKEREVGSIPPEGRSPEGGIQPILVRLG